MKYILVLSFAAAAASALDFKATVSQNVVPTIETRGVIAVNRCGGVATYKRTTISDCTQRPCDLTANSVIKVVFTILNSISFLTVRSAFEPKVGNPFRGEGVLTTFAPAGSEIIVTLENLHDDIGTKEGNFELELLNNKNILEVCFSDDFNVPTGGGGGGNQAAGVTASVTVIAASLLFYAFY